MELTENGFKNTLRKIKEATFSKEQPYSFEGLWKQRNRKDAKPLLLSTVGPNAERIGIGFREIKEMYSGTRYYVLGLFNIEDLDPVGYLVAERNSHENVMVADTFSKSKIASLESDKVFGRMFEIVGGGSTILVQDEFQKRGLGSKMIHAILEIGQKVNAPELIFANVSGYLSRLVKTLEQSEEITLKTSASGNLYLKKR